MLNADLRWIPYAGNTFTGSEPDKPGEGTRQPRHYKSNFVHHGLLQRSTGTEEVDAFYAAVVTEQAQLSPRMRGEVDPKLQTIVAAHFPTILMIHACLQKL